MNAKQTEQFNKLKTEFEALEGLWADLVEAESEARKRRAELSSAINMQKTKVGSLISILQSVL